MQVCLGDFVAVRVSAIQGFVWEVRRVAKLLERGFTVEPSAAAPPLYLWDERGETWTDETVRLRARRR